MREDSEPGRVTLLGPSSRFGRTGSATPSPEAPRIFSRTPAISLFYHRCCKWADKGLASSPWIASFDGGPKCALTVRNLRGQRPCVACPPSGRSAGRTRRDAAPPDKTGTRRAKGEDSLYSGHDVRQAEILPCSAHPEARAPQPMDLRIEVREGGLNGVKVVLHQVTHGQQHLERIIETQERLQEPGLRPEHAESRVGEVDLRVLARQRDVVDVDDHAGTQPRDDFKEEEVDISSGSHGVPESINSTSSFASVSKKRKSRSSTRRSIR
jgi:hypothetical protein